MVYGVVRYDGIPLESRDEEIEGIFEQRIFYCVTSAWRCANSYPMVNVFVFLQKNKTNR